MMFPFDFYLFALLASCGVTFFTLPFWRKWSYRTGLVDDPGHRKIHDTPVASVCAARLDAVASCAAAQVMGRDT